jgi:hypothetical protein
VPSHIPNRIVSQAEHFTAHYYEKDRDTFSQLDQDPDYRLTKIIVPAKVFADVRYVSGISAIETDLAS